MADLQYDYNKDGKVDASDVAIASREKMDNASWTQGASIGLASGVAAGAGIGAGIGALGAGVGAVPGAGVGAVIGGAIGSIGGAITGAVNESNTNNRFNDILKSLNLTDEEIKKYEEALQVFKSLDNKTNGDLTKVNNSVDKILRRAQQIKEAKYGSGMGEAFDMVAKGYGGTSTASGEANLVKIANEEIAKEAQALGIDLSDIKVDENYTENINKKLNSYQTELGIYNFPNFKIDVTNLNEEEKTKLSNGYNVVKKIISPEAGQTESLNVEANSMGNTMNTAAPLTVDNGDGTFTTTTKNADGTGTAVTKDADGNTVKTEQVSSLRMESTNSFGMTGGGASYAPTDYIGLANPKSNETFRTDENGNRIQAEALYTYESADSYFNNLTEQQIKDAKKKLYAAGYYGASDIVSVLQGTVTDVDKKALIGAMSDSNLNGLEINDYLQPKYETFLLTGRPVGEKPVDLNGDGTADASVTTALQSFFDRNGLQVSDNYIKTYEEAIKNGSATLDGVMSQVREKMISSAYPAWKDEIMQGKDIADIASPYVQAMKSTLGVTEVNMNDPLLQQALSRSSADGKPVYTSLFDFKQDMRKDARWENTDEAQKEYADTALTVLKTFGIIG